ncbi:Gfo/Idh/MocA family oxidoreductase [Microcoleus sp. FACHB-68]|uniref:Gfo/Idh/MocA family protein n=1 Tax=Microcoleus sp. FACHB-68 TaxID=2692826 RepID=UPI001684F54D|nr:Gfo/Idh/MocA family oxidoreductase [Microcoleus sp. FACHB-68]MBD1939806.1 Gfo/Idh/MocA family oxidoreductase [Microcoleus sp. FACHB-68]
MQNLTSEIEKPMGIAVLGAGRWGAHLVRNFLEHPLARIVAVVDPHPERLSVLQQRSKLDAGVIWATDWAQVRHLPAIEAVVIATPALTHYALIADALTQGYHVLAEKPLTLNVAESVELCHLAEHHGCVLVVDHTYLFHPAVEQGEKTIQSGCLGQLRYGYATRTHQGPVRSDVDALWDLAVHDINIFNTWLGLVPTQVQATGTVWLQREGEKNLADLVWVTLSYATGFQAFIHLCWCNPDKQRRLGVVGSHGTLIFDEMSPEAVLSLYPGYLEGTGTGFTPTVEPREVLSLEPAEPLARVCDHFLNCAIKKTPSPVSSGWKGVELVRILSALTESMKRGGLAVPV